MGHARFQWTLCLATGTVLAMLLAFPAFGSASCPKLLMFDGTNFRSQINPQQAAYWGETVGVQGFFVNNVMPDWQTDVGTDSGSKLWQQAKQFQTIYARDGVTDNFIKVALYKGHDWNDATRNTAVVQHFAHAAALAAYAGFKGIALDLEPYVETWSGAGNDQLAATIQDEGRAIGEAMHTAFPAMTLVVIKDGLLQAFPHTPLEGVRGQLANPTDVPARAWHGGYAMSIPFLRGLLSVGWADVVIATEVTYKDPGIARVVRQTAQNYAGFASATSAGSNFSVAPGLWPLGQSYADKSARVSPSEFEQHLRDAFAAAKQYVWIYGYGSAWQSGGPYGAAPVTGNFGQYVDAIQKARAACGSGNVP